MRMWPERIKGTSKNRRPSSNATKLPAIDSALFSFRFVNVHVRTALTGPRVQFFEVPSSR
jgi:hypothetical protein